VKSAILEDSKVSGTGTFSGIVNHDVLTTRGENLNGNTINIPNKSRWNGADLYNAISVPVNTLAVATGVVNSKAISHVFKATSLEMVIFRSTTSGTNISYTMPITGTVRVTITPTSYENTNGPPWYKFYENQAYKNGSLITQSYSDGDGGHPAGIITIPVVKGDVISFNIRTNSSVYSLGYGKIDWIHNKTGSVFVCSDNSLESFMNVNNAYSIPINITSPLSWNSSDNLTLTSGSIIVSDLIAYADNAFYPATGNINYGGNKTVTGIIRSGNTVMIYYNNNSTIAIIGNDSEGATTGWYELSGSFTPILSSPAVLVKTIEPKDDNLYDIGSASKRIRNIIGSGMLSGFQSMFLDGMQSFTCRAWVNFSGSSSPSIRASGNVSSVTYLTTGQYQINFSQPMPDVNYVVVGSAFAVSSSDANIVSHWSEAIANVVKVESCKVKCYSSNAHAQRAAEYMMIAFFR